MLVSCLLNQGQIPPLRGKWAMSIEGVGFHNWGGALLLAPAEKACVNGPRPPIIKDAPSKQPVLCPPLGTAEATAVPKVLGGSTPPTLACDGATKVTWGRNSGHSGLCEVAPGCFAIPGHTGVQ